MISVPVDGGAAGTDTIVVVRIVITCGAVDDGVGGCCEVVGLELAAVVEVVKVLEDEIEDESSVVDGDGELGEEVEILEVDVVGSGDGVEEDDEDEVDEDGGGSVDEDGGLEVDVLLVVMLVGGQRLCVGVVGAPSAPLSVTEVLLAAGVTVDKKLEVGDGDPGAEVKTSR